MNKLLLGAVGAGIVVAGYFGGVAMGILPGGTPDEAEISTYLQSTLEAVNNETDYSGKIDSQLRIDDWTNIMNPSIDGKTINFDMVSLLTLDEITANGRTIESYMPSRRYAAKKHVCEIAKARRMLKAGVVFHYTLITQDGKTYGAVTTDKGFCD